jgi:antitoxin YefM
MSALPTSKSIDVPAHDTSRRIQQVKDDHTPIRISSGRGDVVLMSAEDYDSWLETIYLLRSPANARRLMEAVARDKSGEAGELVITTATEP